MPCVRGSPSWARSKCRRWELPHQAFPRSSRVVLVPFSLLLFSIHSSRVKPILSTKNRSSRSHWRASRSLSGTARITHSRSEPRPARSLSRQARANGHHEITTSRSGCWPRTLRTSLQSISRRSSTASGGKGTPGFAASVMASSLSTAAASSGARVAFHCSNSSGVGHFVSSKYAPPLVQVSTSKCKKPRLALRSSERVVLPAQDLPATRVRRGSAGSESAAAIARLKKATNADSPRRSAGGTLIP
mmetsp:Transcript_46934/g.142501  ORF Transcript_46934/g.142501 Transcript_46934/m.142501 type:complete len:246 (-) Transcript_46934:29-766(-)